MSILQSSSKYIGYDGICQIKYNLKILKNVNFEEYLLANKYSLLPNRNIKGFKCYSKSDILGDDVVFVGNHKKKKFIAYFLMTQEMSWIS